MKTREARFRLALSDRIFTMREKETRDTQTIKIKKLITTNGNQL